MVDALEVRLRINGQLSARDTESFKCSFCYFTVAFRLQPLFCQNTVTPVVGGKRSHAADGGLAVTIDSVYLLVFSCRVRQQRLTQGAPSAHT